MVAQPDGGGNRPRGDGREEDRGFTLAVAPEEGGDVEGERGVQAGEDVHAGDAVLDDGDDRRCEDAARALVGQGGEGRPGGGQEQVARKPREIDADEAVVETGGGRFAAPPGVVSDAADNDGEEGEVAGGEQVGECRVRFVMKPGGQRFSAPEAAVGGGEKGIGMGVQPVLVEGFEQREGEPDEGEKQRAVPGAGAQAVDHAPEDEAGGKQREALWLRRGDEGERGKGKNERKQGEGGVDEGAVHGVSGKGRGAGSG